jgi:hypothetical protein
VDQQTITSRLRGDRDGAMALTLPPAAIRGVGALLALAVAAAHVADERGVTAFTAPDWLGWAYRVIEVGGVLVAGVLLWPRSGRLGWAAAALLSIGPFVGYLASRTVGQVGADRRLVTSTRSAAVGERRSGVTPTPIPR